MSRKVLLRNVILIAMFFVPRAAHAAGGACPSTTNMDGGAYAAPTTCYYVDFIGGADTNSGTTESAPWKHAPGMAGATNNAKINVGAGIGIILKGGTTWDYTTLPWNASGYNGSSYGTGGSGGTDSTGGCTGASCLYIGVDHSWYTGGSWTRPVLSGGDWSNPGTNTVCHYDASPGTNTVTLFNLNNVNYTIVDNIEFMGMCLQGSPSANTPVYIFATGTHYTIENTYSHRTAFSTSNSGWAGYAAISSTGLIHYTYNVIDWTDSGPTTSFTNGGQGDFSGIGIRGICSPESNCLYWVDHNVFYNMADASDINPASIHDNYYFNASAQTSSAGFHEHISNDEGCAATTTIYNNVMDTVYAGQGWGFTDSTSCTYYIFNNVWTNASVNPGLAYMGSTAGGTFHWFNNTTECGSDSGTPNILCIFGGGSNTFDVFNNHMVTSQGPGIFNIGTGTGDFAPATAWTTSAGTTSSASFTSMPGYPVGDVIVQTKSMASGQGYTYSQTYQFSPTSSSGATVGAGVNKMAYCTAMSDVAAENACEHDTTYAVTYNQTNHTAVASTRVPNNRPATGAWDVGAYQYPPQAQSGPYGPNTYRNGYGLGDGPIPTTRTNALCTEVNYGGAPCQDPDFPLGGPGPASTWLPAATHTVYVTAVGPQWNVAACNTIDNTFTTTPGNCAGAATISSYGSADSAINQFSYDKTVFCFDDSFNRDWFSTFNPLTGAASPLGEIGRTYSGFNFGGGVCEFSKVPITYNGSPNNGHVAFVYCTAPNNPGLCAVDPYTGVVTVIADFNAIGNFPSDGPVAGTGGEIDLTRDLYGEGVGSAACMSIGVSGETENAWRYNVCVRLTNGSLQWWDVKRDLVGCSTSPAVPGGCTVCNTPAVTQGLCTGLASAPSTYVAELASGTSPLNCSTCNPPTSFCNSTTLISCSGIHGVGVQVDYQSNIYGNISLENSCFSTGVCAVAGPTIFSSFVASGCSSGTVTSGLCATVSTILNGAGHRASVGGGNIGVASGNSGLLVAIATQAPKVNVMCTGVLVPPSCTGSTTIGAPGTDGHDTGNATDNVGSTATNIAGRGLLHFGSFYNGLATAGKTPGIVCNGVTCTITCATNPCFWQSVPETSILIQGSSIAAINGIQPIFSNTGIGSNLITITNSVAATSDTTGKANILTQSCQNPTAAGMDEDVFYSPAPYDVDTNGHQRNYRIRHVLMDTCANSQQFYNLTNATIDVSGTVLLEATNHNCSLGTDNNGNCLKVLEATELLPGSGAAPAPAAPSFAKITNVTKEIGNEKNWSDCGSDFGILGGGICSSGRYAEGDGEGYEGDAPAGNASGHISYGHADMGCVYHSGNLSADKHAALY